MVSALVRYVATHAVEALWVGALAGAGALVGTVALAQVGTNRADFFAPGTQPRTVTRSLVTAAACMNCHTDYFEPQNDTGSLWAHSMMGQSARDPIFHACLAIANQDAAFAGEMCLRCHAPQGWYRGSSDDPTGAALDGADFQGVSCSVCHRAVDPVYRPGVSPQADQSILQTLADNELSVPTAQVTDLNGQVRTVPLNHNTTMVIDPQDRRRGPYVLDVDPHGWLQSNYHRDPALCAHCHDVSNPVYSKGSDGIYRLNNLHQPHPTSVKYDMFPIERTYSEWLMSTFGAQAVHLPDPVDPTRNRFGGNEPMVKTCQDCHMPRTEGHGANPAIGAALRPDLGKHAFHGANTWVLRAVHSLYSPDDTFMTDEGVDTSIASAQAMMRAATDLELAQVDGDELNVRIINQSGHKVPTGYPEGRRMWVNVRFYSASGALIKEIGGYDPATAELSMDGTKIYQAKLGFDSYGAQLHNKPEGPSFHFVLNNTWLKDNRIPPRGFTNARFASVQAQPVGYFYADGQYWDDTRFTVPPAAKLAQVRVYHQVTTKEYIEFLRDENRTNNAGQIAYDQWVLHGKATPTLMDEQLISVASCSLDFNGDGVFPDSSDLDDFLALLVQNNPACDVNTDGVVNFDDLWFFVDRFAGAPCPGRP